VKVEIRIEESSVNQKDHPVALQPLGGGQ